MKEHIAEGAPLDESDHCGDPPMLLAAGNGHTAVCELLINEVRAIDRRDRANEFAKPPRPTAVTARLRLPLPLSLPQGADLQQAGLMKDTPLARAANNGHYQCCKFLIEQGAEVDALDIGDNTALHWAAMRGNVEIVNLLLQNGADKTIKNKQGKIPIDMCQPVWSEAWRYTREILV